MGKKTGLTAAYRICWVSTREGSCIPGMFVALDHGAADALTDDVAPVVGAFLALNVVVKLFEVFFVEFDVALALFVDQGVGREDLVDPGHVVQVLLIPSSDQRHLG